MMQQPSMKSMYRLHGPQEGLDASVAVPAYPMAARTQRRRKRTKRKSSSRARPRTNSSSSEDAQRTAMSKKKSSSRRAAVPMPSFHQHQQQEPLRVHQEGTPQVLLWHNTHHMNAPAWSQPPVRKSSDSSRSRERQEERNSASSEIFRHQPVRRQGPSSDPEQEDNCMTPIDVLAPAGPKWFEWEYWKERLFDNKHCCLPNQRRRRTSNPRREPLIDYRPSYLGRYDDNIYHPALPWAQQQQHYYVMPWPPPQVSPLTEAGLSFPFSPTPQQHKPQHADPTMTSPANPPAVPQQQVEDPVAPPIQEVHQKPPNKRRHHRKASSMLGTSMLGTHFEVPDVTPKVVVERKRANSADAQSVSSLESISNSAAWKTPRQQQLKLVIPDTHTTQETHLSSSTPVSMSNRIKGMRRTHSQTRGLSPRSGSKPPVAPTRRQTIGGTKHKSQITHSTMGSTALPPLPSPPIPQSPMSIASPVLPSGARDLTRSFSEASANTNGSRHRRGGTVCEFSFESLSMNPNTKELNQPKRSSVRSNSLPLEVQIQVHVPPEEERPSIRMVDSKDSWGVTPPKSYFQDNEEETPEGYISPLEEEQFTLLAASPGNRSCTSASPRGETSSDAYAGDIDSPQTSSNPQDSEGGDDSGGDEENNPHVINFEQTSPFAKLKVPPTIPAGESWMWSWVNKNSPAKTDAKAVTPTQSPSSTVSSVVEQEKAGVKTEYLAKNLALEQFWRKNHATTRAESIAVSGWVAFGLGNEIVTKLASGEDLERCDVTYAILATGSETLWLSKLDGSFDSIDLSGCRVEVQEISREHGRVIYLKRNVSGEIVCMLLPVCFPEDYDGCHSAFADGSLCFPEGDYLPDDQQYTTMHIMFALDALLKAKQSLAH